MTQVLPVFRTAFYGKWPMLLREMTQELPDNPLSILRFSEYNCINSYNSKTKQERQCCSFCGEGIETQRTSPSTH